MMFVIYRIKDNGRTIGYIAKDKTTGAEKRIPVGKCTKHILYLENVCISGEFYVKKTGYPDIPDIDVKELKKRDAARKKALENKINSAVHKNNSTVSSNTGNASKEKVKADISNALANKNKELPAVKNRKLQEYKESIKEVKGKEIEINYRGKMFVDTCRKIRRAAQNNRVEIKMTPNNANKGLSVQLFKIVQLCGYKDIQEYVTKYLKYLQPYDLKLFKEKQSSGLKKEKWLVEIGYKIWLVIKVQFKDGIDIYVISFHESNKLGLPVRTKASDIASNKELCGVFVDDIYKNNGHYIAEFKTMKGMIIKEYIEGTQYYHNGIALIEYERINRKYEEFLNSMFEDLLKKYTNTFTQNSQTIIEASYKGVTDYYKKSSIQRMSSPDFSIMSYGFKNINNICFIIDLHDSLPVHQRQLACSLVEGAIRVMSIEDRKDLAEALEARTVTKVSRLHQIVIELCK